MYEKLTLIGRLTADPEMRYIPSGTAVTNFNLAVDADYTDQATKVKVERTKFFKITCWGKLAEVVSQYKHKGDPVLVEGELQFAFTKNADGKQVGNGPSIWNRQDGTPAANYEVKAERVLFLPGSAKAANGSVTVANSPGDASPDSSGIPF